MWNKIKCFFGFHVWERYVRYEGGIMEDVLCDCKYCGKDKQEQILVDGEVLFIPTIKGTSADKVKEVIDAYRK